MQLYGAIKIAGEAMIQGTTAPSVAPQATGVQQPVPVMTNDQRMELWKNHPTAGIVNRGPRIAPGTNNWKRSPVLGPMGTNLAATPHYAEPQKPMPNYPLSPDWETKIREDLIANK